MMLSIDSPPRYFSATLPPPKTKMHAASTQVIVVKFFGFLVIFLDSSWFFLDSAQDKDARSIHTGDSD